MSWFKRAAERKKQPGLRDILLALAELEIKMVLDVTKLQSDVASQGILIQSVQAEVDALKAGASSSADQAAIDAVDATVVSNNAALQNILTPASS